MCHGRHSALQKALSVFSTDTDAVQGVLQIHSEPSSPSNPFQPQSSPSEVPQLSLHTRLRNMLASARLEIQNILNGQSKESPSFPLFFDTPKRLGPIWCNLGIIHAGDIRFWLDSEVHRVLTLSSFIY